MLHISGWINIGRLLIWGAETTAVYESFDKETHRRIIRQAGTREETYYIRLSFRDHRDKDYTVWWDSSYGFYSRYNYGLRVNIKYLPDNPQIILPDGELYHALINYLGPAIVGLSLLSSLIVIPIVFYLEKKSYGEYEDFV